MMTIDEVIGKELRTEKDYLEYAKTFEKEYGQYVRNRIEDDAEYHRKIAEWLEELKQLKAKKHRIGRCDMRMTIDEVIGKELRTEKDYLEYAKTYDKENEQNIRNIIEDAAEYHRKVAEWLKELKQLKGI